MSSQPDNKAEEQPNSAGAAGVAEYPKVLQAPEPPENPMADPLLCKIEDPYYNRSDAAHDSREGN